MEGVQEGLVDEQLEEGDAHDVVVYELLEGVLNEAWMLQYPPT